VSGAISSGGIPGIVDLAPNYAGVLQGINGTIVASFISVSPYIVGLITYQQVDYLLYIINIITLLFYLFKSPPDKYLQAMALGGVGRTGYIFFPRSRQNIVDRWLNKQK